MENRTTRLDQIPKGDDMKGRRGRTGPHPSSLVPALPPAPVLLPLVANRAKRSWSEELAPVQGEEGERLFHTLPVSQSKFRDKESPGVSKVGSLKENKGFSCILSLVAFICFWSRQTGPSCSLPTGLGHLP